MHSPSIPRWLSEAELLRKVNLTVFRAGKLRAAGKLSPDGFAQDGRVRLYRPERVTELAALLQAPSSVDGKKGREH